MNGDLNPFAALEFFRQSIAVRHLDLLSLGDLRELTWIEAQASAAKWHWRRDVGGFPLEMTRWLC